MISYTEMDEEWGQVRLERLEDAGDGVLIGYVISVSSGDPTVGGGAASGPGPNYCAGS
jgi:hypothetical protein